MGWGHGSGWWGEGKGGEVVLDDQLDAIRDESSEEIAREWRWEKGEELRREDIKDERPHLTRLVRWIALKRRQC